MSHSTCDRRPAAKPANNAAGARPETVVAPSVAACTASAAARPGTSLSGRDAVNQYNGAVPATIAATTGSHGGASALRRSDEYKATSANTARLPATMLTRLNAFASDGTTRCTAFASTMNKGYPGGCG